MVRYSSINEKYIEEEHQSEEQHNSKNDATSSEDMGRCNLFYVLVAILLFYFVRLLLWIGETLLSIQTASILTKIDLFLSIIFVVSITIIYLSAKTGFDLYPNK